MFSKAKMKDVVVILPGIMGSVLQKDGKDIWNASAQVLSRALINSLEDLKLKKDDPSGGDIEDRIKPTRLITDTYLVPGFSGFGKIVDGYNRTSDLITKNFDVIEGNIYDDPEGKAANFYHFPYDWRRDNRANANILKNLLDKRLKRWRKCSENNDAKVILLAHSMGGLISRYYLEVLGGWKDCKVLFTFGTPYRGSVKAINILTNGLKKGPLDLGGEFIPTLTSLYQLLPRYKALQVGDDFYRLAESPVDIPNIDRTKAIEALKFHNEIDDAADRNNLNPNYKETFVTCPIVGVRQPTLQSAQLVNGVISFSEVLPTWMSDLNLPSDGDGTVPELSATPAQMSNLESLSIVDYIAETHGALQNQHNVLLNLLKGIQTVQTANLQNVRGSFPEVARRARSGVKGIGLILEDLFLVNEPITLRAKVSDDVSFNSVTAEIICVSEKRPVITRNFVSDGETWAMAPNALEAGLYRVKVQTDNTSENAPNPVHDTFLVADLDKF